MAGTLQGWLVMGTMHGWSITNGGIQVEGPDRVLVVLGYDGVEGKGDEEGEGLMFRHSRDMSADEFRYHFGKEAQDVLVDGEARLLRAGGISVVDVNDNWSWS